MLLALVLALAPLPERPDYQKIADAAPWEWKANEATLAFCLTRHRGDNVTTTERPGGFGGVDLVFRAGRKDVLTVIGHRGTVFVAGETGTIFYADFGPISSGCALVAFDLGMRKQLWKCQLKGLGPIDHTKYRNEVRLDVLPDGTLRVYGHESAGDYVEYVDGKTGKTVGHKVFARP
jgi:hypothetical protein